MNNRRRLYYPAMAYLIILLLVWILSWVADVIIAVVGTDVEINSLIGGEGLRWAMRNAMDSLNAVPWGVIFLVLVLVGLLNGSGIVRVISQLLARRTLTKNQRRSILFSAISLFLYVTVIYLATLSPFNVLLGVTGKFEGSPLAAGMPLLFFTGVLFSSLVYGFLYGNYRSPSDVLSSVCDTVSYFVPALLALLPAAGIIPCIAYVGVFDMLDINAFEMDVISVVLYTIPFMHYITVRNSIP